MWRSEGSPRGDSGRLGRRIGTSVGRLVQKIRPRSALNRPTQVLADLLQKRWSDIDRLGKPPPVAELDTVWSRLALGQEVAEPGLPFSNSLMKRMPTPVSPAASTCVRPWRLRSRRRVWPISATEVIGVGCIGGLPCGGIFPFGTIVWCPFTRVLSEAYSLTSFSHHGTTLINLFRLS